MFTSHAKEQQMKSRGGQEYSKIFPSMPNQARSVVEALVDLFFYVDYVGGTDSENMRIIITEGDELIWSGHRKLRFSLPRFIPLTEEGGYEILSAAFKGEDVGLNPKTLLPRKTASSTLKKFYAAARTEAIQERSNKKPAKKKKSKS